MYTISAPVALRNNTNATSQSTKDWTSISNQTGYAQSISKNIGQGTIGRWGIISNVVC
jgi:hypothetical protein